MTRAAHKEKRPRAQRRRANAESKISLPLTSINTVWFYAIFGCALLLRLTYLAQIESIPLFYHIAADGRTYDGWGQRFAAGAWLGAWVFYQAHLYPYYLVVCYFVLG